MAVLENLEPKKVFKFFEDITKIPHGSGNEKALSDFLVNFAKERNLEVIQDSELNVIIRKTASSNYEGLSPVIIQGHMDMVCEKNKDINHDFLKDPLKLRITDDYIYANGTTLGADNGIAVAFGLALLDSNDIPHPPLEILVTTGEETGMYGANAVDPKHLNGKALLNIDAEEEGVFFVSCAGGATNYVHIKNKWENTSNSALKLEIKGLRGGHSGMEIIKQRGNSNKLMGRLLNSINKEIDFNIAYISGGAKNNAIPRESEVILSTENTNIEKLKLIANNTIDIFKKELRVQDPDVKLEITEVKVEKHLTTEITVKIINFLNLMPNGIQTMSKDIEGLVESSLNLGVIIFNEDKVTFESAVRSSVKTLKVEILDRIETLSKLIGAELINDSDYPEWQFEPNSKLRDLCVETYKEIKGQEPKIDAIHAGLECGLLKEKMPDVDMISFGPNLYDVHTPDEHISITSVQNLWEFIIKLMKNMK
ncbi:aminoacyl-histidine dipeptidase [Sedimentibacter sp. MB31-C6]|uniref:aminoacyl-histidine dipeptidase n=1 Tax=Sedimentibacter sp. MB31-C6 TaxID=3109366 RepID=UPI002DDCC76F|nr:aminoacyl-histidine dipeptidase [Sedimentibacter sp. MB36-C1]WSI04219.1 aminoacyl-histidine dipeptidase [Sedimentibacter sp. MB36-C1]